MTTPAAPNPAIPTPEAIRQIVAEVMRRISPISVAPIISGANSAPAASLPAPRSTLTIVEKVVTLHMLERLPVGTRSIALVDKAVLTPSARDYARDAGIEITRRQSGATASAARLFVIAHADCPGDAAGHCASIARSVPGSQQLPASGLVDLIAAIAMHAARDGARAVLLTSRPSLAVILANRSTSLRAVTSRDVQSLATASAQCSANLLVANPQDYSLGNLQRVCLDFVKRNLGPLPLELTDLHKPCTCSGH